jgi:hypothetical protein
MMMESNSGDGEKQRYDIYWAWMSLWYVQYAHLGGQLRSYGVGSNGYGWLS